MLTCSNIIAIQEQIKILESVSAYIPREEIEMIMEKSKAKIEAAKVLQRLIEELKKSKGYLTDEEMNAVEESLKHFQL
jgi:NADH:ubiquinone oxidoreductase subunit E